MNKQNIVLIGSGNVATHLGSALKKAKQNIIQVYSRNKASAKELAETFHCDYTNQLNKITHEADVYIVCIKDDVIEDLASHLPLKDKIIVHTSGSMPMHCLKKSSKNIGVLYPLQTFSKLKKVDFKNVPMCIEANNRSTYTILEQLAKTISKNVLPINSEQRLNIHIAAVFACNFTNHMYTIADNILKANKLSLDLIKPLITETAEKIKDNAPDKMQTGPAIRGDKKTMDRHLKTISTNEYKKLYKLISADIQKK
jgi:predicted short-subunit dehydrogenase-like oxidoreductase (DUF2520 family)